MITTYQTIHIAGMVAPSIYDQMGVSQKWVDKVYYDFADYTDGELLATYWSWPTSSVANG